MINRLNNRLKELQIKLRERDKLSTQLTITLKDLDIENVRMDTLKNILDKEQKDVECLEGLSLTSMFYQILGSKEEQLAKEKQELLAAKLKYEEAKSLVTKLQVESARLVSQMGEIEDLELEYVQLLSDKEKLIKDNNFPQWKELFKLSELEASITSYQKELTEAVSAGEQAIHALDQCIQDLKSAENWGVWDMLGGGVISTAIKHSRIDSAQESLHQAQYYLNIFHRELSDLQGETSIELNLDGFTRFADYFFDNLITDWIVQRKINDSLNSTINKQSEIQGILENLKHELDKTKDNLKKVKDERAKLLTIN